MILVKVHEQEQAVSHRIEVFPCLIGRSMHCGLRIDEPSISARHAELHATDDGYSLRDLGSTNGIIRHGERVTEVKLGVHDTLYLGDVRLDLLTEDQLEKTHGNRMLPEDINDSSRWLPAKVFVALVVAAACMYLVPASDQYQLSWPPENPSELYRKALYLGLEFLGAALVVSFFCKLNAKRFHFHNVLILISGAYLGVKLSNVLTPILIFNLHNLAGARYLRHLGYAVVAFVFTFWLQRYAFRRWRRQRRMVVALTVAILSMVVTTVALDRHAGERDRMADLGPPLGPNIGLKQTSDDLLFAIGLAITAADQQRIETLEKIEAERLAADSDSN